MSLKPSDSCSIRSPETPRVLWGRMVSCAPVGNRRWVAICKGWQAGYQPAAGCQPAPPAGAFRHRMLRASIVTGQAAQCTYIGAHYTYEVDRRGDSKKALPLQAGSRKAAAGAVMRPRFDRALRQKAAGRNASRMAQGLGEVVSVCPDTHPHSQPLPPRRLVAHAPSNWFTWRITSNASAT